MHLSHSPLGRFGPVLSTVDVVTILLHPFSDFSQKSLAGFLGEFVPLHQGPILSSILPPLAGVIPILAQVDELFGGLKVLIGYCITSVVVHSYTGLPRDQLSFLIPDTISGGNDLLRSDAKFPE